MRLQRAFGGQITTGGATSPQEAAAFASSFALKVYAPAHPISANAKLAAAAFSAAAGVPDDGQAAKIVLSFGATGITDTLKATIAPAFARITGVAPGSASALARDVLQHAATVYAAAGEAGLAAAMLRAAGGDRSAAQAFLGTLAEAARGLVGAATAVAAAPQDAAARVLDAAAGKAVDAATAIGNKTTDELHQGVTALVGSTSAMAKAGQRLLDQAEELPRKLEDAAGRATVGALNLASSAKDALVAQGNATMRSIEDKANALAAAGQAGVRDTLTEIRKLADQTNRALAAAERAPEALLHALETKAQALSATLERHLADAKASADATAARWAHEIERGMRQVSDLGAKAAQAAQHLEQGARQALTTYGPDFFDRAGTALAAGVKGAIVGATAPLWGPILAGLAVLFLILILK